MQLDLVDDEPIDYQVASLIDDVILMLHNPITKTELRPWRS